MGCIYGECFLAFLLNCKYYFHGKRGFCYLLGFKYLHFMLNIFVCAFLDQLQSTEMLK